MMAETVVTVETPNRNATPAAPADAQGKSESNLNWLKLNPQYFRTIPGILKIVQVTFTLDFRANGTEAWALSWEFVLEHQLYVVRWLQLHLIVLHS
ncbi:AGAP000295-PA-like protein [Anopheles sinensis]|uniref:AGAP000295-PA-like protein n=1 Tax=Anopheles sinensis TaxID=74873 RepID=A0A084WPN9_ANOSI|nr:AGAP000295-PA-like protein [Anopheles sinensis]